MCVCALNSSSDSIKKSIYPFFPYPIPFSKSRSHLGPLSPWFVRFRAEPYSNVHTIARTNSNPRAPSTTLSQQTPSNHAMESFSPESCLPRLRLFPCRHPSVLRVVLCCFIFVRLGVGLLAIQFLPSLSGRSRSAVFEARPRERHGPVKPQGDMQCGRYIDDAHPIDTPPQSHRTLLFDTLTTKNVAATSPHTRHIRFQPYCTRSLSQRTKQDQGPRSSPHA
jgi:hypothetical protein